MELNKSQACLRVSIGKFSPQVPGVRLSWSACALADIGSALPWYDVDREVEPWRKVSHH